MDALKGYAYPRKALSDALVRGDLVRVKKGLYVQSGRGIPAYSREVLANMIYGPSYISFEYALAYYGLIPERVEEIASATTGKSKLFTTPAGRFSYMHVSTSYYSFGFGQKLLGDERTFLIADPEKAVADRVIREKGGFSLRGMKEFLFDNLRIDAAGFPESRQKRTRRGIAAVRQTFSWAAAHGQGWSIVKTPLDNLLSRYTLTTTEESLQALREITQEIALLGLWRGKFFEHAAFYGGSALRIVDGLPRYSEDLDFSLLVPNPGFKVQSYFAYVEKELRAFGFDVSIVQRPQNKGSAIDGAFVKMNTREGFLTLGVPRLLVDRLSREQVLKIKFEIDIDPPGDFRTEMKYLYMPQAFSVRLFDLPSQFAGKLHAAIARKWKTRVKGRDWFDLGMVCRKRCCRVSGALKARLVQTGTHGATRCIWRKVKHGIFYEGG